MIKRLLLILALSVSAIFMTGCEAMQVNERVFVQMLGIEDDDGICRLTLQVYSTEGGSENTTPTYEVLSGSGRSIREAADNISRDTGRDVYFGHCMFIVADEKNIRDIDTLEALAGEQISIGSRIYYSDKPSLSVAVYDEDDKLIGADKLTASALQYEDDGLCCCTTLKDITAAVISGKPAAVPFMEKEVIGTAVVNPTGKTSLLSLNETAVLNLLNGKKGISLNVMGADISVEITDKCVYHNYADVLDIQLCTRCLIDEIESDGMTERFRNEIRTVVEQTVMHIYRRAVSEGFGELLNDTSDSDGWDYSPPEIKVNSLVELKTR